MLAVYLGLLGILRAPI